MIFLFPCSTNRLESSGKKRIARCKLFQLESCSSGEAEDMSLAVSCTKQIAASGSGSIINPKAIIFFIQALGVLVRYTWFSSSVALCLYCSSNNLISSPTPTTYGCSLPAQSLLQKEAETYQKWIIHMFL